MKNNKILLDLQAHLFLDSYGPEKVVKAMNRTNLDAIAIERYNHETDNFSEFVKHQKDMKNKGYDMEYDNSLVKVIDKRDNKEYFGFKAQEISTSDDYHVLVYGTNSLTPAQPIRKTMVNSN
jgi:2',3'-cyclic-nucleotide 2'-phosphodiesterase (5'-nucleotidase family)